MSNKELEKWFELIDTEVMPIAEKVNKLERTSMRAAIGCSIIETFLGALEITHAEAVSMTSRLNHSTLNRADFESGFGAIILQAKRDSKKQFK